MIVIEGDLTVWLEDAEYLEVESSDTGNPGMFRVYGNGDIEFIGARTNPREI